MARDREIKSESSIPVMGRVDVVDLAKMLEFWQGKGEYIRTMSQLVGWSIGLVTQILENNGYKFSAQKVVDAHEILSRSGLYQPSMRKISYKKVANAMRFESMREEGIDPKTYVPQQYNVAHNKSTVESYGGQHVKVSGDDVSDEELMAMAQKTLENLGIRPKVVIDDESYKRRKEEIMEQVRKSGLVVDDSEKK